MSNYSFKRATQDNLKPQDLEQVLYHSICAYDKNKITYYFQLKKGIVRFLCGGVFLEEDILSHLIVASADTRFSVATPAIAELSKISS